MTVNRPDPRSEYSYGQNEIPSDKKKNPIKAAINKIQKGAESAKNTLKNIVKKPVGKDLSKLFPKSSKKEDYVIDDSNISNNKLHAEFQKMAKPISAALTKAKNHNDPAVDKASAKLLTEVISIRKDINTNATVDIQKRINVVQSLLDELNKLL